MNEQPVVLNNITTPFDMLALTSSDIGLDSIWRVYNFPIILLLIFFSLSFLFLFISPKRTMKSIFTYFVLISIIPISYLLTIQITNRKPASFKEAIKYEPQYNLIYSNVLKFLNNDIYFIPSNFDKVIHNNHIEDESIIKVKTEVIKRIYFNETKFPDPLSNQTLSICSIFLFVAPGYGDLSNSQYISLSWNQHNLINSCSITAKKIGLLINHQLEILNTSASVFEYDYPKDKDEFNAGLLIQDNHMDEHDHDHSHD